MYIINNLNLQEQLNRIQEMMGLITEIYDPEEIRNKYVSEKNILSNEQFDKLKMFFPEYQQFVWILKKLDSGCFGFDETNNFVEYFKIFNKKKKMFPIKDLGQIKTCEQTKEFVDKVNEISKEIKKDESTMIKSSEIKKLEDVYIKYMGKHNGFQVFVVPALDTLEMLGIDPKQVYSTYRNVLGQCENRSESNKVNFCTTSGFNFFNFYIEFGELFVFHKIGDPNSPYQIGSYSNREENFNSRQSYECRNKNNQLDEKVCPILFDIFDKVKSDYTNVVSKDYLTIKDKKDDEYNDSLKKSFFNRFRRKPETDVPSIIQYKR